MFFKKFKKTSLTLLLSLFIIPFNVFAYSNYLIPGGENIGIQIQSKGIIIVGMYEVNKSYPAYDAGLEVGDIITKVNNEKVNNIDELVSKINELKPTTIEITYTRENKENKATLKITKEEDIFKTGLYVKDSITGIGTLSFIDPETKIFGALGHEIIEQTTGKMLEVKDGKIFDSSVTNIERSENGNPGSKNADFNFDEVNGKILENTQSGIFGKYTKELPNKKKYKVAKFEDIKLGKAKIMTVLEGNNIKEYDINIIELNNKKEQKTKNILFEVIDQELLNKSGGIVQGMSGSTIIQGEYIIGAVTHVVVDNPKRGYGILIVNMLEEAEN